MIGPRAANGARAALIAAPLLAVALAPACDVPDVQVEVSSASTVDGASNGEASIDAAEGGTLLSADGAAGGDRDAATGGDAGAPDALDPSDAPASGEGSTPDGDGAVGPYCASGNGPPTGAKCCSSGAVCYGTCNKNSCNACGSCTWPMVCCTQGAAGTCETSCKHDAGSSDAATDGPTTPEAALSDAAATDGSATDAGSADGATADAGMSDDVIAEDSSSDVRGDGADE